MGGVYGLKRSVWELSLAWGAVEGVNFFWAGTPEEPVLGPVLDPS